MKNLKKVLALVLVVAIMASFAVGAGATFTDADEVSADYSLAVDVLTGMKVINGYADGSFRPDGNVTRGAFAKMVAYVMTSGKNAPASYATSAALAFSDVDATATLAPSIGYAVAKGYVNGYADGTFRSGNSVTGLAAAKILLGALGFDGSYAGTGWDVNVLSDGEDAGLFAGLDSVDLTKPLTREQAAQMIWNAINYSAKGATSQYVVTAANGETVLYQGNDALTALIMQQANDGATLELVSTTTDSLGFIKFGLTKTSIPDAFGREPVTYTNGESGTDLVVYASFAATPVLTYTTAVADTTIAKTLGATASKGVSLKVIDNGKAGEAAAITTASKATTIGGNGTLVEVYKNDKGGYNVIVIDTYVYELEEDDIHAAQAATLTKDAVPAYIEVDGLEYETDAFKAGDVVLFNVSEAGKAPVVTDVVKADFFSGFCTATAATYFRVDGAKYELAANNDAEIGDAGYKVDATTAYTYYTDLYGYVIYAVEGETVAPDTTVVYQIGSAVSYNVSSTAGDTLFDGTTSDALKIQIKYIDLTTGEIKVANIGTILYQGAYYYATATGARGEKIDTSALTQGTTVKVAESAEDGVFVALAELDDGSVVLASEPKTENVTVEAKNADIGVKDVLANSKTALTVVTYDVVNDKATVATATGIANFPAKAATYEGAYVVSKAGVATSITAVVGVAPVVEATTYSIYVGEGETTAAGTMLQFFVNGEIVEYVDAVDTELKANSVYAVEVKDGKLTKAEKKTTEIAGAIGAIDETYITVDGKVYYFAASYEVVDLTGAAPAVGTLAVKKNVEVYLNGAGAIEFITIVPAPVESEL